MQHPESKNRDKHICMHLGENNEHFLGAAVPPVYNNTFFLFPTLDAYIKAHSSEKEHYVYWRGTNPTVEIAEKKLAALEGGESCKCFASGMAAIVSALLSCVQSGDHIVCVKHIYEETKKLLEYVRKFGVSYTFSASTAVHDIEQAIRPETTAIILESPTSFNVQLVDIAAVAELAKRRRIRTIIDNSWATPLFQKPLALGMDMVVHSASKYLGGHSDLLGGAVIGKEEHMKSIFYNEYMLFGAPMAPSQASLLLRGLRTLPLRMEAHQDNALQLARFLQSHPSVAKVNHPALESHPDYELGKRQLFGYSGLFSFELRNPTFEAVKTVMNRLTMFKIGVSWGSLESLALTPNDGKNAGQLRQDGINPGLIRISAGLEDVDVLIHDLDTALYGLK